MVRVDGERFLKALRSMMMPLRIVLLAAAEQEPGIGKIRGEVDRLPEEHDRAVVVAPRRETQRPLIVLLADLPPRESLLDRLMALALVQPREQSVVIPSPRGIAELLGCLVDPPTNGFDRVTDDGRKVFRIESTSKLRHSVHDLRAGRSRRNFQQLVVAHVGKVPGQCHGFERARIGPDRCHQHQVTLRVVVVDELCGRGLFGFSEQTKRQHCDQHPSGIRRVSAHSSDECLDELRRLECGGDCHFSLGEGKRTEGKQRAPVRFDPALDVTQTTAQNQAVLDRANPFQHEHGGRFHERPLMGRERLAVSERCRPLGPGKQGKRKREHPFAQQGVLSLDVDDVSFVKQGDGIRPVRRGELERYTLPDETPLEQEGAQGFLNRVGGDESELSAREVKDPPDRSADDGQSSALPSGDEVTEKVRERRDLNSLQTHRRASLL